MFYQNRLIVDIVGDGYSIEYRGIVIFKMSENSFSKLKVLNGPPQLKPHAVYYTQALNHSKKIKECASNINYIAETDDVDMKDIISRINSIDLSLGK